MTDRLAWSQDDTKTIRTVIGLAIDNPDIEVFDGRATPGAEPPFVVCWQLGPQQWGAGLAAECWGQANQVWQIGAHGLSQMQARHMAEQLTGYDWPDGWELVEVGPLVEDTADKPPTWFIPIDMVYRQMT